MAYTRLDLRNVVRRELQDTGSPPLWTDTQLNDDLAAAFATYSQYFPIQTSVTVTSVANQAGVLLGSGIHSVQSVTLDGYTVPQVPDQETLYEPATRGIPSQSQVQPISSTGAMASHVQAWTFFNQSVYFRFPLTAGRTVTVYDSFFHVLPSDDVTAITIPDVDIEIPVLYACDRLVQSAATDAIKRGAPGAWVEGKGGIERYAERYHTALNARRRFVRSSQLSVTQ